MWDNIFDNVGIVILPSGSSVEDLLELNKRMRKLKKRKHIPDDCKIERISYSYIV